MPFKFFKIKKKFFDFFDLSPAKSSKYFQSIPYSLENPRENLKKNEKKKKERMSS